jgi:hypothetical protein
MAIIFNIASAFVPATAYSANAMFVEQAGYGSQSTWRLTFTSGVLLATGGNVRVELEHIGTDYTIGQMWIGTRAGAGDQYDYASTPTQILFSGGASVNVTETDIWSDWLSFTIAAATDYIIGFWVSSASPAAPPGNFASGGALHAQKSEANEPASPLDASGFGTGTRDVAIKTIEVA